MFLSPKSSPQVGKRLPKIQIARPVGKATPNWSLSRPHFTLTDRNGTYKAAKRVPRYSQPFSRKWERNGLWSARKISLWQRLFLRKTFEQDSRAGISLLFRQYYSMLCSHAVRYVSSKAIAEDIVSDVFYEFQVDQRYQTVTTSFRAYLFTMVRNRAFDYVRTEMQHTTSLDKADSMPAHFTQNPDSITQYEELYHDVENAINAMPLQRRKIYVMHRFEGKKYQEIAVELNLSLRTIETHVYKAIHQIRDTLKGKWLYVQMQVSVSGLHSD